MITIQSIVNDEFLCTRYRKEMDSISREAI